MKKLLIGLIALTATLSYSEEALGMNGTKADKSRIEYHLNGRAYIGETAKAEQIYTEINQRHLLKVQPPESQEWSLERENLKKRAKRWNDKNKLSYIYTFSMGRLVGFYAIKGKVSSVNSQLTNPEMVYNGTTLASPSEDGSYGSNGDAVFWFNADGTYMEWNGEYMLVDRPLKLNVEPMVISIEK